MSVPPGLSDVVLDMESGLVYILLIVPDSTLCKLLSNYSSLYRRLVPLNWGFRLGICIFNRLVYYYAYNG